MLKKLGNIVREKNMSSLMTNVLIAALGLFSFMLLTRQLSKELFGDWVLYVTLATFVDLLRFGLTQTSSVRLLSGAKQEDYKKLMGSSFKINLKLLGIITLVCWSLYALVIAGDFQINYGYFLFLTWYPILAFTNLSWNNAMALFQAKQDFKGMMYVRLSNIGLFVVFLVFNHWLLHWGILEILWVHLVVNVVSSVWCIVKKWDGCLYLKHAEKKTTKELINFGKYSMGTLVGSSLLKSADTFIIGMSPILGSAGIAMYAIPLKLTDLLGIPLRSFTMTAYPRMSKKCIDGDMQGVRKTFYAYSGAITLLFVPVAIVCFILAEELVLFLGGNEYIEVLPQLTLIFRIFTLYTLLLPIDRFTGVLLDSINKPRLNLNKVIIMTLANIVVDLIAVFVFESLALVAVGTVIFTLIGIFLGFYYLRREIQIQSKRIFPEGILFFKSLNTYLAP
ncbi:oligosaccharide flippase family protein [Flagellimonas pacifica]|uniref:Membrane protein involved in the export of O-antigen and teichoic acid n=1 Tax=Flagellimonas pacifica TaxID=1247520 RepID=A0A285MX52_9FLAO|nr:oligosaccharide flippase family protein [Allomuricauda parva]SNZ01273.1 Membrane protein involved in the export of O-antigen and teichoic acid [Allomuricauda parva]